MAAEEGEEALGIHMAFQIIAVQRGNLDPHFCPVAAQLFRDVHCHLSRGAIARFRVWRAQGYSVIRRDFQKGGEFVAFCAIRAPRAFHGDGSRSGVNAVQSQGHPARCNCRSGQELAALHLKPLRQRV
jgi:hypothetical protein